MSKFIVTLRRISTFTVEAASQKEVEAFVGHIRDNAVARQQTKPLLDMTHKEVETVVETPPLETNGVSAPHALSNSKARWILVGNNLTIDPLVVPTKDGLALLNGDFSEDKAVTASDKRVWTFFPEVRVKTTLEKMVMEKRLVHIHSGQVGDEFAPRYMVEAPEGVWIDQAFVQQKLQAAQGGGQTRGRVS